MLETKLIYKKNKFLKDKDSSVSRATTSQPRMRVTPAQLTARLRDIIHRESIKNKTLNSCPYLPQMLTDFQNPFTDRLTGKFATNLSLNIPPHLKYVTTLPCEIGMSETSANLKYALC